MRRLVRNVLCACMNSLIDRLITMTFQTKADIVLLHVGKFSKHSKASVAANVAVLNAFVQREAEKHGEREKEHCVTATVWLESS